MNKLMIMDSKIQLTRSQIVNLILLSKRSIALIFISGIICFIGAYIGSRFIPNVYQARAQLVITKPAFKSELSPEPLSVKTSQELIMSPWILDLTRNRVLEMHQYLVDILSAQGLSSKDLSNRAKELAEMPIEEWKSRYNIDTEKAMAFNKLNHLDLIALYRLDADKFMKAKIEDLQKKIGSSVQIERKTNISVEYSPVLTIFAKMETPEMAKIFVNTLAQVFVDLYSDVTSGMSSASVVLIEEKYNEVRSNLIATEDAITAFVAQYKLDIMEEQIKVIQKKLSEQIELLKTTEQEYQIKNEEMNTIRTYLTALKEDGSWIGYFLVPPDTTTTLTSEPLNRAQTPADNESILIRQSVADIKNDYMAIDRARMLSARQYRVNTIEQQLDGLRYVNNSYQEELYDAQIRAQSLEKAITELTGKLQEEGKVIALQRGITEEALWEMVIGKPAVQDIQNLGKVSFSSEEINPVYTAMANQLFQYQSEMAINKARVTQLTAIINEIDQKLGDLEELYTTGVNREQQLYMSSDVSRKAFDKISELYVRLEGDEKNLSVETEKLRRKIVEVTQLIMKNEEELKTIIDLHQEKKTEHDRLVRDFEIYQASFKTLGESLEQARMANIKNPLEVRIATYAVHPTEKVAPRRSMIALIGGLIGVIGAILVTYLIYTFKLLRRLREKYKDSPVL